MAKVTAICGKICSGKTTYAKQLQAVEGGVLFSCDELTMALFDNDLGDKHDDMALRIRGYFKEKALETVSAGCSVILDWGFWQKSDRDSLTAYFREHGVCCQWHYMDVDEETWEKNIRERNERILKGNGGSDYYLDEGLRRKLEAHWEEPKPEEMDVWVTLRR